MKKIIITLASLFVLSHWANGQCIQCDANKAPLMTTDPAILVPEINANTIDPCLYPTMDAVNTFDWQNTAFLINKNNSEYTLYSPFSDLNNSIYADFLFGPNPDNNTVMEVFNKPEDGWELVKRDMGYFWDVNGNISPTKKISAGNQSVAYILLYNKYSSVLRVIATLTGTVSVASIGEQVQIQLSFINGNQTVNWKPTGLFNYYNQTIGTDGKLHNVVQTLDMPSSLSNIISTAYWEGNGHWFFSDFQMAYDPCACRNPSALRVDFVASSAATISLSGGFYGIETPITNLPDDNPITWLSSFGSNTDGSGSVHPQAGMQTLAFGQNAYDNYEAELEAQEADEKKAERKAKFLEKFKSVLEFLATVAEVTSEVIAAAAKVEVPPPFPINTVAAKHQTERTEDANEHTWGAIAGVIDGLGILTDFVSVNNATPTGSTMPFIIQGEMVLSGTATFSNPVPAASFSFANPGSSSTGITYPEFSNSCYTPDPINQPCSTSPGATHPFTANLPGLVNYNEPMGHMAVLNKPTITYNTMNYPISGCPPGTPPTQCNNNGITMKLFSFHLDGASMNYVFNPAVPVDEDKTPIHAAIVVNLKFPTAAAADAMFNNYHYSLGAYFTDFQKITDDTYQILSTPTNISSIGSVVPWFGCDAASGVQVESVYLRLIGMITFKPDPKYPTASVRNKVFVVTYPVTSTLDPNLKSMQFDPDIAAGYGAYNGGAPLHNSWSISEDQYLQNNPTHAVQNFAAMTSMSIYFGTQDFIDNDGSFYSTPNTWNFYSDGTNYSPNGGVTVYPNPETGVTVMAPNTTIYSGYEPNTLSFVQAVKSNSSGQVGTFCTATTAGYAANTYVTGVSGASFKEEAPISTNSSTASESLLTVFPNPTIDKVSIKYQNLQTGETSVNIKDALGEVVKEVTKESNLSPGLYEAEVDLSSLPAGIYSCSFVNGSYTETQRLVLIK
ncbi:MAG: hypothetical protein JWO58_336 [Chitinophagaceae bacterium]|nr:hypothetical protein [Chitinophagaceae bacterium]